MKTTNSPLTKKSHIIVLITALSLLIAFGGYFYYKKEESSIRRQKYSELKAIADLKASQIEQWVHERISDAKVATQSTEGIKEWLKDTGNVKLKQDIIKQLQPFQKELGYENIFLAAPNGRLLLSAQAENREFDSFLLQKIIEASEKKEILLTDFYMSQTHNKIHYDIIAPIINEGKNTIAVLLFRTDPNIFLYPLIQLWPTPSPSSETTILSIEQDSVVFLNELRHRKNTALQLKIPLTRTEVPSVQAALGRTGLYEGIDYRGVEVLSDIRVIPATNWIMLAKVDRSEIFSGLYVTAAVISGFTFLLIIICGIGLVFIYNSRQKNIFKELYNKEKELWQHQERFRVTMESLGEGIITTDLSGKIQYLNSRAEALTGWNIREARGRMLSEIYHVKNEETGQIENNILDKVIKHGIVKELANHTILITKSGKEIPVMDTGAPIFNTDGSVNGIVITFHDEAEKRTQQKLIKDNEEKYRFLSAQFEAILDHVPGLVFYKDTKNNFIRVNRYFAEANKTTKEAFENKNCADIYPKEDAEKYYEDDLSVINSGVAKLNIEEPWITETGSRWINTSKIPFVDNAGNIIGVIGLSFDITERKRADERQASLSRILEESLNEIYIFSVDDLKFIEVNKGARNNTGYSIEELRQMTPVDLKPNFTLNKFNELILPLRTGEQEKIVFETVHRRKNGTDYRAEIHLQCSTHDTKPVYVATILDITERVKSEEKLRESNERFNSLVSALNDVVWTASGDGSQLIDISKSFETVHGRTVEEFKANPKLWIEMVHPDDIAIAEASGKELMEKGKAEAEYRTIRPDGTIVWVLDRKSLIYDETGKVVQMGGIAKDITERKQAEESLREKEERFRRTLDLGVVGMATTHPYTYYFLSVNKQLCEMLGYTEEELLQKTWAEITFPKEKVDEDAANVVKLLSSEINGYVMEKQYQHKDGHLIDITLAVQAVRKIDGTIDYILILVDDITQQKQTERFITIQRNLGIQISAINNFNELYKVSLNSLMEISGMECGMIYRFDKNLHNLDAVYHIGLSEQFVSETSHYNEDSPNVQFVKLGKPAFVKYADLPVDLGEIERAEKLESVAILPIVSKEKVVGCINLASRKNTPMHESLQKGLEVLVSLFSNAIERLENEEEIRNMNTNLEIKVEERTAQLSEAKAEADRANVAKSEFLSRMSHELRTPMNSILGFTQLMNMGELTPAHKKRVDHILNSGKHLLNLINEVLDLSRIEAGKLTLSLEPVQLSGIVAETLDVIKPLAAAKNITFNFPESSVCALFVKADRVKIKQVLLNLVSNSVKYNRDGGSVKVECKSVGSRQLAVGSQEPEVGSRESEVGSQQSEVGSREPEAETLRISVVDTGVGIAPEEIENLFIPFKRIGAEISEIEGTGLGLTVAKKLIEAMGGTIGVESEPGQGSTFWVELPQAAGQTERQGSLNDLSAPEKEKAVMTGTILYIEDNLSNIHLVAQILEEHRPGIKLISETHGRNTVKLATDYKPALILLDLDLPDIHGSEVLKRLQENKLAKLIPVVILSADAMGHQMERLIKAGAKAYITKPLDVVEFLKIVDGFFGKK